MKQEMTMHRAYFMGHDSICIHTRNGDSHPFLCRITDDIDSYEEKAAFIVRACNAHDDLVAALGAMLDAYEMDATHTRSDIRRFRAALAKAKGEQ